MAGAAKRFHLKPMLPLLSRAERFYVLAITEREMRFFEGDRNGLTQMVLRNVPQKIEEAPGYDNDRMREAVNTAHFGGADANTAGTRGHQLREQPAPEDDILWRRSVLNHFIEEMDKALWQAVSDHKPPLIVAAPSEIISAFEQLTTYPNFHEKIEGNPEALNERDLFERAWPLVEPLFRQHRRDYAARFEELIGTGQASAQLEEILSAAHDGRIDRVFVAADSEIWGTYDPVARRISLEDAPRVDNYGLLDDVARETIGHAGEVFLVPRIGVPSGGPLAATFRW